MALAFPPLLVVYEAKKNNLGKVMGPFDSRNHHHRLRDEEEDTISDLRYQASRRLAASPPSATHIRHLLLRCAQLITQADFSAAHRLISILSSYASPCGDSTERLVHQLSRALSNRLAAIPRSVGGAASASMLMLMTMDDVVPSTDFGDENVYPVEFSSSFSDEAIQSCYLSLNQITPFIRFSHLTANQAILEAIEEEQREIHILDFEIMHGVQWPPLMQALVERSKFYPPPMLRITGTGRDLNFLCKTGDRLSIFAQSLGLSFQFQPLLILNDHDHSRLIPSALTLNPNEALAVNCVFYLHRFYKEDLHLFLHRIKSLKPKVVTLAESEANHDHPLFLQRFVETLDHYSAIFDSLEATLPPSSSERLAVEQTWFGREIMDVVANEGTNRRQIRHQRYESWELMLRSSSFSNIPLSSFALSQAKLLLRLHYPSEGYHLHVHRDSLFLGWQNRPLFSVSSWH